MVKLWLDVVSFHNLSMEGMISCLVPSSPPMAHLAFSCARTHSNDTAEMTVMVEALSFFGPRGPVARDEQSCIFDSEHAAGVCLGMIKARTHVQLALACQKSVIFAQRKLRLTMQHVRATVEILLLSVLTMPLHLGHSDLPQATMFPPAGFIITLTLPFVFAVTASAKSRRNDATSQSQNRRMCGVHHLVHCVSCASHALLCVIGDPALSFLFCS